MLPCSKFNSAYPETDSPQYRLFKYFGSRGANIKVYNSFEQHTTASHILSTTITVTADFYSSRGYQKFADDIRKLDDLEYEEYLRSKNPTLARAYEEYQILLKLSE